MPFAKRTSPGSERSTSSWRAFCGTRSRPDAGSPYYHFQLDLPGGPCAAKRLTGCGAGYQYLAVTPDGALYPCHQFVGHPEYCLGDLDRGITRPELQEQFRQAHVFTKTACRTCWARFLCGGGCHAQAALLGGGLKRPYSLACKLVQARLEGALYYLALGIDLSVKKMGIIKEL